jgi:hypothetical protein
MTGRMQQAQCSLQLPTEVYFQQLVECWAPCVSTLFTYSYAPTYDDLDGGLAARAVGFDELRAQLVGQVGGVMCPAAEVLACTSLPGRGAAVLHHR